MASPIYNIEEPQEENSKLELLKNATAEVYSKENIETRTDLDDSMIMLIGNGKFFSKRYNLSILDTYLNDIMTLRLSKGRKSRGEHTAIAKALLQSEQEESQKPSMMDKLFGNRQR